MTDRQALAGRGQRLEYFTIVWNSLEGLIAVSAGVFAGSISLVGFGMIEVIGLVSPIVGHDDEDASRCGVAGAILRRDDDGVGAIVLTVT